MADGGQGVWDVIKPQGSCFWEWKGMWGKVGSSHTAPPCLSRGPAGGWAGLRVLSYRTATVWKTLCPFWGEEYQVHLPPTFHAVAFYVMDEDALR